MKDQRKYFFTVLIVLVGSIFLIKLFAIQVWDDRYGELADSNSILRITEYPYRGLIYDRNGNLLVYNEPEFDLMVQENEMQDFDSLTFCALASLDLTSLRSLFLEMKGRKEFLPYKPILFMSKLSAKDVASLEDRLDEFPGFYLQARTTRAYTWPSAANALGYVSEISSEQLTNDSARIYKQGDYIGQSGIEAYYAAVS